MFMFRLMVVWFVVMFIVSGRIIVVVLCNIMCSGMFGCCVWVRFFIMLLWSE